MNLLQNMGQKWKIEFVQNLVSPGSRQEIRQKTSFVVLTDFLTTFYFMFYSTFELSGFFVQYFYKKLYFYPIKHFSTC